MKCPWISLVVLATLLLGSPDLLAHGGQYRGPGDIVPPNPGGGGDITPPGNPPGNPGPGSTTGVGGRSPTGGRGPNIPGAGTGGMRSTTGAARRRGAGVEGFERWEFWWEHNKDPFLLLKARLGGTSSVSFSTGYYTGRGNKRAFVSGNRPSLVDVKTRILPTLLELLGETHSDVVDSAAIAIPRMLPAGDAGLVIGELTNTLSHREKTARESATLGLGILGSTEAVQILKDLLHDTEAGRRLTGRDREVEDLVRAFAAASLGLIGDSSAIEDLQSIINDLRLRPKRDLKVMAILALGLMPDQHQKIAPYLLNLMRDRSLDRTVRAQAPVALGRLHAYASKMGSPEARATLPQLLGILQSDKTDNDLKRSVALALGMLAEVSDPDVIDTLLHAAMKSADDQTRYFSIMALARIGGRDHSQADPAPHLRLRNFFLTQLTSPKRATHQPYGALGLAVYAKGLGDTKVIRQAGDKIAEQFQRTRNPSYLGAMAVSLGLLEHRTARTRLWERFEGSRDEPLKGYIALSLGLMRDTARAPEFRALIQNKGLQPKFRLQLARALGLMGDTEAVKTLVDLLQTAPTLAEASSSAQALGLIGDRTAIDSLLAVANSSTRSELQRGFAAAALGIVAEKQDIPWNTVFAVDSNYRAKVPALAEILDLL